MRPTHETTAAGEDTHNNDEQVGSMDPKPVIFLDVDGVLTASRCLLEDYEQDDEALLFSQNLLPNRTEHLVPLEISMIQNLKYLIEQTEAKVVLSSTWRESEVMKEYLLKALESQGIPPETVIGETPCLSCLEGRGAEIRLWLSEHHCEHFVILDDDHFLSFQSHALDHRLVQTRIRAADRTEEGLTRERCERAISLLLNSSSGQIFPPRLS
jgi:hypothetical protein